MAIEDTEKAYLGPLNCQILLALGLQYIQNNRYSIFVIITNDSLIRICSVALDDAALFLRGLRRLVIFQEERLRVEHRWIFTEQQSLHLDKLNVRILIVLVRKSGVPIRSIVVISFKVSFPAILRLEVQRLARCSLTRTALGLWRRSILCLHLG